jgi:hypothetical protein
MSTNGLNRNTQLLSDAPASEDAFEGGHNRVAEALAGLIQDEKGGKALALKGPFGSGKSTVVRLLENELEEVGKEKGEDTRIFKYDAWEHQGDPLRRSFIESLVEFLEEEDWAEEDEWGDEIERIARRKEETTHKTEPVLTEWGRKVALALFLSPLGLAGFAVFARGAIGAAQAQNPSWWWFGGFVGLAVIALGGFLFPLFQYKRAKQNTDDEDGDPFYLFFQKTRKEKETKTIRTPDPTTIEFQEIFRDIISQTLEDGRRQLIVVVDNLDRLPPDQALSTWATMRTFFETEGANEDEWMDRFWLIVPLNFEALRGIFTDSSRSEGRKGDPDVQEGDSVEAFANKTFSTVLRVAPPVLSDWEQFMKDQLSDAFYLDESEDSAAEAFHAVYRLYRIAGVEDNSIPTPRDVKIFINRLSGLYRQWGDEIGLPMLAAYQLESGKISQDGQELTDSMFLPPRIQAELRDEDWQNQFAALHFNVHRDKATQVLIEEQVQTALETGNEEETVEDYADIAGFASVVGRVIPRIVRGDDPSTISLAGLALDTISLGAEDVENDVWRKLRRGIRTAKDWFPDEDRKGQGLINIIRRAPEHQQDKLAKDILSMVSSVDLAPSTQDLPNATHWTNGVLPLVRAFKDREKLLRGVFQVPRGWPTYINVISHLRGENDAQDIASFFIPADEPGGIDAAVAQMISADSISSAHSRGLQLASQIDPISNVDWTETSDAIYSRLNWNNNLSDEELRAHLNTALAVATVHGFEPLQEKLGDNTGRANLSHHIQSHQNSDQEIMALCVLLRVLYSADKNRGANNGNANQGHSQFTNILQNPDANDSIVKETANLVQEFDISWCLLNAANRWEKALDFVQRVVRELATTSEATTILGYSEIARFPNVVGDALQEDGETFKKLVLSADLEENLSEELGNLDQGDWLEELKSEGRLLDVVLILTEEEDLKLSSAFQDALLEHAKLVLDQQSSPGSLWFGEWSELLDALSNPARNSFLRSLQNTLLAKPDQPLAPALSIYGDEIANSGVAANVSIADPTDTVNEHFRPLLQRGNPDEVSWLSDVLEGHPELAQSIEDDDIWIAFQELIEEKCGEAENDDVKNSQLERIADLAGVELTDSGEDTQEDEEVEEASE